MTSTIIVSANQFQMIIVLILSTLNVNWFSDCMFEFILWINWKSVLSIGALESSCTGVAGWSSFGEIALQTKRGFPSFSLKKINWWLQGGNHIDVPHGRCANSLEFSCLLWQPVINFSALWNMSVPRQARYRTQLDFIRKTSWTSNDQSSNRSSRNSPRSTESL